MTLRTPSRIFILLTRDTRDATGIAVLSVHANLQDANTECLRYAAAASVELAAQSSTSGPDPWHNGPVEPLR